MDRPLIITKYGPDGSKVRRTVGFQGAACLAAAAPYEAREVPGGKKTPTAEMYEGPDGAPVRVSVPTGN